jgi:hypothetical protein
MRKYKKLLAAAFILISAGCKKAEQYSVIPSIAFKSISISKDANGYDTNAHIVISFTDGDGDLGYSSPDGLPNDFIIKQENKKNGIWTTDTIDLSGHLPLLTPEGNNKSLKGEIATDVFLPLGAHHDTLKYAIYILDRALHQSNTDTTSAIVVTTF